MGFHHQGTKDSKGSARPADLRPGRPTPPVPAYGGLSSSSGFLCVLCALVVNAVFHRVGRVVGRGLVGEGLEEGHQAVHLVGLQVAGTAVAVTPVAGGEHVAQGFRLAVVEVGGGAVDAQQGGGVVLRAHLLGGVVTAGADVVQLEGPGEAAVGVVGAVVALG